MATRGARPKPGHLRVVDGTHRNTRHGDAADAKEMANAAVEKFGALVMPKSLKGKAAEAWKKYIAPASWLDGSKEPAAIAFCHLWAEFMKEPGRFVSAKHGQMRAYMSELGLTDERNRVQPKDDDEPDEFFGQG